MQARTQRRAQVQVVAPGTPQTDNTHTHQSSQEPRAHARSVASAPRSSSAAGSPALAPSSSIGARRCTDALISGVSVGGSAAGGACLHRVCQTAISVHLRRLNHCIEAHLRHSLCGRLSHLIPHSTVLVRRRLSLGSPHSARLRSLLPPSSPLCRTLCRRLSRLSRLSTRRLASCGSAPDIVEARAATVPRAPPAPRQRARRMLLALWVHPVQANDVLPRLPFGMARRRPRGRDRMVQAPLAWA